jgi:predicted enzyme related to lactoylglutathione lyase
MNDNDKPGAVPVPPLTAAGTATPSPIRNRLGAVFIPVSDIRRSAEWYATVLGQPLATTSHEGRIYAVPMAGETGLILDAHKAPPPPRGAQRQTLCFFWADDVRAARIFLIEHGVEVTSDVNDIGSVSFVTFNDPDGNPLMVCQQNGPRPASSDPSP